MPKRFSLIWRSFLTFIITALALLLLPGTLFAASSPPKTTYESDRYFDFGPYYGGKEKVLGLTFSSLENLPPPETPDAASIPTVSGVLPGDFFHPFESFAENTQLTFTFNPVQREQLRLQFAQERLSEAKTLIDQGKPNFAQEAIHDYQDTMNTLSNNLPALANNPQAGEFLSRVEETAASNMVAASNLALISPPAVANTLREAVNASERSMDAVADAGDKPPIPDALSESIQKLKAQGIITPEESDKLYALDKRSEVREELEKLASSGQFPLAETVKLDDAVSTIYPDTYNQTVALYQFAELRSYQTFPPPSDDVVAEIKKWQDLPDGTPPPSDIKPYLYYTRAEELAKTVDLTNFDNSQQAEVVQFYPQVVEDNPTFSPLPLPSPKPPSPEPSPSPDKSAETSPSPSQEPASSESPQPSASPETRTPTTQGYLTGPSGPLPGDPTYFFKRFTEETGLFFTFDPASKIEANMRIAEERLREASILASDKDRDSQYQDTLKAYQQKIENASTALKGLPKEENESKELAKELETQAARHEVVFETGLLPSPEDPKVLTEAIEKTQNAMDRAADTLERPALPLLLSSRLQDMKAQGLILPEEVDKLSKAPSREEVRAEIRKLTEIGTFPPADAKKLDEAQNLTSSSDYNQLVEVRKVEELQTLRAVQAEFAQVPALRATNTSFAQRVENLVNTIDSSVIKPEDLAGHPQLVSIYEDLIATASARPINGGQFGAEATPGAQIVDDPRPVDAVSTTCPVGAVFKQFEGCVWEESGKRINDYEQYRCERPGDYYSFAAGKCVPYDPALGRQDDERPICQVGYSWSWETQSCQTSAGGRIILPSPTPQPSPRDDEELEERSKSCPAGSSYKAPQGCVWDESGDSVYDSTKYRCNTRDTYYSFEEHRCVSAPKQGEAFPKDAYPECKDPNTFWSWSDGKCITIPESLPSSSATGELTPPKPSIASPDSPFYFFKQAVEAVQSATAFTPQARQEVRLAQARERFAEGYYSLEKNDEEGFKSAIASYTGKMQEIYNDLSKDINLSEGAKKALGDKLKDYAVEQNLLLQKATVLASDELATPISAAVSVTIQGIDRAADLSGDPAIPEDIKAKIEQLPDEMIPEEERKKILEIDNRVEARLKLNTLVALGALTQQETAFVDDPLIKSDPAGLIKLQELKKLDEIVTLDAEFAKNEEKVEKTEEIVKKLDEFRKDFEVGNEVPPEIRPYVRLTRIDEVAKTIRPDLLDISDFGNRKDLQLAVATLREEFKPTRESLRQLEDFRRSNPGRALPYDLARIEALSYGLGVRSEAGPCFLPSPPFPANTPCPPPGAAIPISSYYSGPASTAFPYGGYNPQGSGGGGASTVDKEGKPLVYGQGPSATSAGVCPDGYHWMYDSGGWCMSNGGSYNTSSGGGNYYNTGGGGGASGFTPYSPYYSAPGVPPTSYGYQGPGTYSNVGSYGAPSYYGVAPTYYTTNPLPGTVPGSGPAPTASGQCPSGFHWMPPSGGQGGWCMSDGNTYVPGGTITSDSPPTGGYNCGSQPYDPVTKKCKDGACPGGFNWDGSKCVSAPGGGGYAGGSYYSPNLTKESCGPGYYWDGKGCIPTYSGSGGGYNYSPYSGGSSSTCSYPTGGCSYNSYFDWGSCSCKSSYNSGSGTSGSSSSSCSYPSGGCGSSSYFDYGTCSCKSSGSYSSGYSPSTGSCTQQTCSSGQWFDWGTCSCRSSTSTTTTPTSGSTTTSGGSSSSSGSCPSGYHWMGDNGGWCMSDGGGGGSSTPSTSSTPTTTSQPAPAPTTSEPAPAPAPAPPPAEPAPAPPPPPAEPPPP